MNKEKAVALVKQALSELQIEIEQHTRGVGTVGDTKLLLTFKNHLEEMLEQLENNRVPEKGMRMFGMGHAIVDSWPWDSQLGSLLCSAEQAYRSL